MAQRVLWFVRGTTLHGLAFLTDRFLLRLALDRWPSPVERRQFRRSLRHGVAPLPPLLRGFAAVADARAPLTRAMLVSWLLADERYQGPMRQGLGSDVPPGDHLRVWTKPPISFLHVERTAGTALVRWLSSHFHPAQIDPDPFRSMPPHVLSPFVPDAMGRFSGFPLVHGHYDLPSLHRLGTERAVVMMLREPRARLLSLYYFWRSIDPGLLGSADGNWNVRYAHDNSLLDFLSIDDPYLVDCIDNPYVRRLTGSYASWGDDPLSVRPLETLDLAVAALRSLRVVGIVERMEDSLRHLGTVLGFDDVGTVATINDVIGNRRDRPQEFRAVEREQITPAVDAAIERLIRHDRVVYDEGMRLLRSK